jgi:hypothetical protein
MVFSLQVFHLKFCMHISYLLCMLNFPPNSSFLIW